MTCEKLSHCLARFSSNFGRQLGTSFGWSWRIRVFDSTLWVWHETRCKCPRDNEIFWIKVGRFRVRVECLPVTATTDEGLPSETGGINEERMNNNNVNSTRTDTVGTPEHSDTNYTRSATISERNTLPMSRAAICSERPRLVTRTRRNSTLTGDHVMSTIRMWLWRGTFGTHAIYAKRSVPRTCCTAARSSVSFWLGWAGSGRRIWRTWVRTRRASEGQ